jgi:pSer/pThr/pTyr-binding forkhead associated (FHA) protein
MSRPALRYLGHRPGASLSYFTGAGVDLVPGQRFEVPPEGLVLGRRASATVRVASSQVAPAHARIGLVNSGLGIEDLRSTNGTQVNDKPVTALTTLHAGDRITIAGGFDFDVIEAAPGVAPSF